MAVRDLNIEFRSPPEAGLSHSRFLPLPLMRRGHASADSRADAPARSRSTGTILAPGRNCWRRAHVSRAAFLVDGCSYFSALSLALESARRSIMIVGWDFDGRIRLDPVRDDASLGERLRRLVEERPELEVRILVWSTAVLHGPSGTAELLLGNEWQDHPRITLTLDTTHPIYAAHHQKIVCIDGNLCFVGGMDLTVDRWDTPEHIFDDPRRVTPDGVKYGPVHDTHLLLEGEAARAVCTLARSRWQDATGEDVRFKPSEEDMWPAGLPADVTDAQVGISRVLPAWGSREPVSESPELTADALRAARRCIFIEAQYLTADFIGDILADRLKEPDGPDVVALVSRATHTLPEHLIMGENRDRLIRRLTKADRYDRFRIYHPIVPSPEDSCAVLIHSKLILVDDSFVRIGSSNLNNRSIGLDSELDISIEAQDPATRGAISSLRDRLIAEHLGRHPDEIARLMDQEQSLISVIEQLNSGSRRLKPFDAIENVKGPKRPVMMTPILDPKRPFEPDWLLRWRGSKRA